MEMGRDTGTCFRAAQHTPIYKKDLFLNAVYTQVCIYGTLSMYSQAVIGSDVMTAVWLSHAPTWVAPTKLVGLVMVCGKASEISKWLRRNFHIKFDQVLGYIQKNLS